jgi:hypothetical protein
MNGPRGGQHAPSFGDDVVRPSVQHRGPKVTAVTVSWSGNTSAKVFSGIGQQQQFTATASLSNGTKLDVTASATWTSAASSATGIATVSSTGMVTAQGFGLVDVSATYQGQNGVFESSLAYWAQWADQAAGNSSLRQSPQVA